MKNVLFIFLIFIFFACNKERDHYIYEYIEINVHNLTTSTIKLDSFPTSQGKARYGLLMGCTDDPVTGITIATPYYVITPNSIPDIDQQCVYDSISFFSTYNNARWGYFTTLQTFHLYRLTGLPLLNPKDGLIYNNYTVSYYPEPLGSYTTWPTTEKLNKFRFRLDDVTGNDLFLKLQNKDEIIRSPQKFIEYFKGIMLAPDPSNNCILNFASAVNSLGIDIHYHRGSKSLVYTFSPNENDFSRYAFSNIVNNAAGTPYAILTKQSDNLPFVSAKRPGAINGQAVLQGGSGYLIKMKLPISPLYSVDNKKISKTEIVLKPQKQESIPLDYSNTMPSTLFLYKPGTDNKILSTITDKTGNPVKGRYIHNSGNREEGCYIIDITDYYFSLCQQSDDTNENYVLAGIPLSEMASNFSRLAIDELPILKIYYGGSK